jgi:protein SCO1
MRSVRSLVPLIAAALVAVAAAQPQTPGRVVTDAMGIDQKLGNQIPLDTVWQDHEGNEVRLRDVFRGKPVMFLPVFYSCAAVCQLQMEEALKSVVKLPDFVPGDQFDIVAVSINPKETPDLARIKHGQMVEEYLKIREKRKRSLNPELTQDGIRLLTGDMESIREVTASLGFRYAYDERSGRINHPAGIMVVTPSGRVSKYFYGATYPTVLVRKALEEAAQEKIGDKAELSLLGCVMLDPATGERTIVIENVLRLLCVITLIVVVTSIVTMSIKTRRQEGAQ